MKRITYLLILILVLSVSCEEYLDPKPADGMYDEEFVWSNPTYARGVLMSAYQTLRGNFSYRRGEFLEVATDDAVTNDLSSGMRSFSMGQLSPAFNYIDIWSSEFERIRNINTFLENGLTVRYHSDSATNAQLTERYKGEALFMRAYLHWKLLKYYGGKVNGVAMGVPYAREVMPVDEWMSIQRPTYQDCAEQIYADCDEAANYLPKTYTGVDLVTGAKHTGGATSDAAIALKSIVALFAASPAYNPDNDLTLWEDAVDFTIDALTEIDGDLTADALPVRNFFDPEGQDVIWRGNYVKNYGLEISNLAPSLYGNGLTNPSQNLVDAFPMGDGYPIEHDQSLYNENFPYLGRDQRLNEFIVYNGSFFNGNIIDTYEGGKDSYSQDLQGTRTGYFVRKFMSPTVELYPANKGAQFKFYVVISKTELYFALAEAMNEYIGPEDARYGLSAKDVLSKIRKRAGFDPDPYLNEQATAGKSAFRQLLKNERRIELCFEDRRFWDLRRWDDPVNDLEVYGMKVTQVDDFNYSYEKVKLEERSFQSPYLPIPEQDAVLLENVSQNDGW